MTTAKEATAKKNREFGYKAVIRYPGGRTHIPIRTNFQSRDEAVAYAQKWIDANDSRPLGVRKQPVTILAPTPAVKAA